MTDTPDEKSTAIDESELAKKLVATDTVTQEADAPDVEAAEAEAADAEPTADAEQADAAAATAPKRKRIDWARVAAFGLLPALALILALTAGWLKYVDNSASNDRNARDETVQVARDSTIALLSYQPDKVEKQLTDARSLLTGDFKGQYTDLITNVVIPGAVQKQISAVATVPRAASVSVGTDKAVVLVFVNQTVVVGGDAPTSTASSVRVQLDKVDGKWLISKFAPV